MEEKIDDILRRRGALHVINGHRMYTEESVKCAIKEAQQQVKSVDLAVVSARTELKLLRTWDAPTHFFPEGIRGSALYFANVCGMSVENFIEDYELGRFNGWFEPYVR